MTTIKAIRKAYRSIERRGAMTTIKAIRKAYPPYDHRTHWDGCETSHPQCAVQALLKRVAELEGALIYIQTKSAACLHSDQACQLVYEINNASGAPEPSWRNWECRAHNYSGSGPVSDCPECTPIARGAREKANDG